MYLDFSFEREQYNSCSASLKLFCQTGMFFGHLGRHYICKSIYYFDFDFGIFVRDLVANLNYYPSSVYLLVSFADM